jgi:mono/diheme cytochrome c family protein
LKWTILGGTLTALAMTLSAAAQEQGDPAAGRELASKLCTACHIVGTEAVGSDVAPPFPVIAKDPELTFSERQAWLSPMHPILPNLALTPKQIADINAYLDSLRPGYEEPPPRAGTEPPALEQAPPERLGEPIEPQPE